MHFIAKLSKNFWRISEEPLFCECLIFSFDFEIMMNISHAGLHDGGRSAEAQRQQVRFGVGSAHSEQESSAKKGAIARPYSSERTSPKQPPQY